MTKAYREGAPRRRADFGGHGVESFKRSILGFAGMGPIRDTLFGAVEAVDVKARTWMIARVRAMGVKGR